MHSHSFFLVYCSLTTAQSALEDSYDEMVFLTEEFACLLQHTMRGDAEARQEQLNYQLCEAWRSSDAIM